METRKRRREPERPGTAKRRPGREWTALAAECAVRALMSAVLAAGNVLDGCAPFSLGYLAASGAGAGGFCALMGAIVGYVLSKPLVDAFRYAATAILIYAVAFAFYDLKLYATRFFMPLSAALMGALTGFVYLAEQGWQLSGVISFVTELALTAFSARFFALWMSRDAAPEQRNLAALLGIGALGCSLHTIPLPLGVSLGAVLCTGVVLWCARYARNFTCAAASLGLGLCLDLAAGGGCAYAAALGVGGLLSAVGSRWGRHLGVISLLCGTAAVTLWSWPVNGSFAPLLNAALGCALYLALPLRWLDELGKRLPRPERKAPPVAEHREPERQSAESTVPAAAPVESAALAQERLRQQSGALRALYEQLAEDVRTPPEPQLDAMAVFERAGKRVCLGCVFRSGCWKRELAATRKALRPAAEGMEKRGRADPADFPVGFAARCSRLNELVNEVNQQYTAEQTRRRYRIKLQQSRQSVCRQYDRMARLLEECALSLEEPARAAMGQTTLTALAGVAASRRPGQSVSGDAGGWFRDERGVLWVVLCDGMGSGPEAAKDSRFAYRLLEQLLSSGIGPETALGTLGGALELRWECTGGFTTIDLLELDLQSGEGAVYKLGAGPTYLRRDGVLSRIGSSTLPAGLRPGGAPDVSRFRLRPGDLAVLVSDGVTDGSEDDWVRARIRAFAGDSPKLVEVIGGEAIGLHKIFLIHIPLPPLSYILQ